MSGPISSVFRPNAQNRVLMSCVLVSLALHALALLLPGLHPGEAAPAATRILRAIFTPRGTAPAVREVDRRPEPEQAKPAAQRPGSVAATAKAETVRRELDAPRPGPEARIEGPREAPATPTSITGAPSAPAAASVAAAEVEVAGAANKTALSGAVKRQVAGQRQGTGHTESPAEAGTLDQYRLALIGAARRYKHYPAQAMDRGWQGRVEIRLVVGANGAMRSGVVKSSSGYEILDSQALDMVKKAKPLTPIPPALRGREFTVDVPVIFDLQSG